MAGAITVKASDGKKIKTKPLKIDDFKGYVIFKRDRSSTYKGEFGFDWMRSQYKTEIQTDFADLEKEYAPVYKYKEEKTGHKRDGENTANDLFVSSSYSTNNPGKSYYTPWYIAFNKSKHTIAIDLEVTSEGTGEIKFESSDKNLIVQLEGGGKMDVSRTTKGKRYQKKLVLQFTSSISKHAIVEARFYDKAGVKTDGEVIGLMNIYKNNKEYDLNIKYVKLLFSGPIKFDGKKYHLDPVAQTYNHYTEKINSLNAELAALQVELQNAINNPPWGITTTLNIRDSEKEIREDIRKKQKEITEAQNELTKAKAIDKKQKDEMTDYQTMISHVGNSTYMTNVFGQALIRYINNGIEATACEVKISDFISAFNFLESMEITKNYELNYSENYSEFLDEITKKYYQSNAEYVGSVNFLVPFSLPTDTGRLLGMMEALTCEADDAILSPDIIGNSTSRRAYSNLTGRLSTIVHEIAHGLTLHHIFPHGGKIDSEGQKHAFTKGKTENIMDYSAKRKTFWKWQIDRLHKEKKDLIEKTV